LIARKGVKYNFPKIALNLSELNAILRMTEKSLEQTSINISILD
jgi:hypothetical protein